MNSLRVLFGNISIGKQLLERRNQVAVLAVNRSYHKHDIPTPKPGTGKQYRRKVHYPEDRKYTIKPLPVTHLAGRDPVTGRVVAKGIGGGVKHKYHWIKFDRDAPDEGFQDHRVLKVLFDGHREANVALIGHLDKLQYIIATENMKPGDLIRTSKHIPKNPVRPNEGDAYPLGALPIGAHVSCVQKAPADDWHYLIKAGEMGTIVRKFDDKVVVQLERRGHKVEWAFDEKCMATVGRVSMNEHFGVKLGSHQRNRELGNRPRSGLWQRKSGKHGRKIKPVPPMRIVGVKQNQLPYEKITLTMCPAYYPVPIYGN